VKLIVGLGNPGAQYRGTRHNVGFEVVDELARRRWLEFGSSPTDALMARERGPDRQVMLAKPLTYMNRSGGAVAALQRYYRIDPGRLLVVADDVNLPVGRLRARRGGSDGGHNGFASIIQVLGTDAFARLRVGVGRGHTERRLASHVLARFDEREQQEIAASITRAADAVEAFVDDGIDAMMNRFNRDPEAAHEAAPGAKQDSEGPGAP
jgi:PTH1 family peptidyl-tRNA hydrolase